MPIYDDSRADKLHVGERVSYNTRVPFGPHGMAGTVRAESLDKPNTYKIDFDEDKYIR